MSADMDRPAPPGKVTGTRARSGDEATSTSRLTEPTSIAADLRRRREASNRLTPLADGRRDPIDPTPIRKYAHIRIEGAALRISGPRMFEVLRGHGFRPIPVSGRSLVDARHLDDVVAVLEHAGYRVKVYGDNNGGAA